MPFCHFRPGEKTDWSTIALTLDFYTSKLTDKHKSGIDRFIITRAYVNNLNIKRDVRRCTRLSNYVIMLSVLFLVVALFTTIHTSTLYKLYETDSVIRAVITGSMTTDSLTQDEK